MRHHRHFPHHPHHGLRTLLHMGSPGDPHHAAAARHPSHPAHGGHGGHGGFGGFGGDGDGMPRGRKFTSDDLQLLLLGLLEHQPSHGYELIKALQTRSNGYYSPSPGMIYPALTYLEELAYVTVELEGNRKRYALAAAGAAHLTANRERVELMFAKLSHIARKMDSVRRAFAGETAAAAGEGGDDATTAGGWLPELIAARHALKYALLRYGDGSAAEQRRIAAILMRATAEIEARPGDPGAPPHPSAD